MPLAVLGLGSNLADRQANLAFVLEKFEKAPFAEVLKVSSLYETEPVAFRFQPWFLNAALLIETRLAPDELLMISQLIEIDCGRTPEQESENGPRLVDIDLLLYGQEMLTTDFITVPHPRLHERGFVLAPLAEICPDWIHPLLKQSIQILYQQFQQLNDPHVVKKLSDKSLSSKMTAFPTLAMSF